MLGRRLIHIFLLLFMVSSVFSGGARPAAAMEPQQMAMGEAPHYFSHPNYANSPLRLPDAMVEIMGGGGMGATAAATVDVATGSIVSIEVLTPGEGYTSPPMVMISSAMVTPSSPASATAIIDFTGLVTGIEVTAGGSSYTAPVVEITGGGGSGAAARVTGGADAIIVTNGGSGYTQPVAVFTLPDAPDGVRPSASVNFDPETGAVTSIDIVHPGSGYLAAPGVSIIDGADPGNPGPGTGAEAVATMAVSGFILDSFGSGYTSAPDVTITDSTGVGSGAAATASITTSGGSVTAIVVNDGGSGYVTPGIKKFVDTLPGLGPDGANNLGQYIPVAVPDVTTYPGSDYYEIGLVQYREQMHSDLPPTLLRGYVQISTSVVPGAQVPLSNAKLDGSSTPIMGFTGVDNPHYLGPLIVAVKDRPVRIKFYNLLPTGEEGNLFIPVDTTVMGSGMGPMMGGMDEMDPQNPMCGMNPKPMGCYSENRATLHLHGGITPWISDGTAHQWITPAGENTPYPQGVSVQAVPDMNDSNNPTDGSMTFYYTNQQSARLMFYHDHAYGITRLNVYAGEAAGYLLTDPTEQSLISQGILPADQIPMIIQDKTFVPEDWQLMMQDETWDSMRWGGLGNLWLPHVYSPAQNPGDPSGVNDFGRWAYGPWFWPPTNSIKYGPVANPYYDPDCNPDDQWCEPELMPGVPYLSMGMEAFQDTPVVNGTAYPTLTVDPKSYRMRILNAANDRFFNLSLYQADATGTEVALNAAEVAAALIDPAGVFPTPDEALSPKGPSWIQVGTEGGFLPSPVVIPPQTITWVTDPTVFNAGNVDKHSLLLGPAERADVIVDFSAYRGKTLILYNDAPAAFPARDPRYDYYTGSPDLTDTGGVPTIPVGFGPNTRTVMQIKVADVDPAPAFNLAALVTAFKAVSLGGQGVFQNSQHPIIVGQQGYNNAYGTSFRTNDGLAQIFNTSLTFKTLAGSTLTMPMQPKMIQDEMGEAFEHDYGRMSGNLGVEAPNPQAGLQNMILYAFMYPPTEVIKAVDPNLKMTPISTLDDGTQIWKITHNGVDTHPIHWHLYDVQLINRVGWDGIIRKPDLNELGWKDTIRISPLEDTIVALRPITPVVPFDLPNSVRLLDPTMPEGAYLANSSAQDAAGLPLFAFDPNGEPIDIINHYVNFGWEYTWHCHILSHEEMDMMRPTVVGVAPKAPTSLTAVRVGNGNNRRVDLAWADNSLNETNFVVERATSANGPWTVLATLPINTTSYTDPIGNTNTIFLYRVKALNIIGDTWDYSDPNLNEGAGFPTMTLESAYSNTATFNTVTPPNAPTNLSGVLQAGPQISLTWTDNANNETGFIIERAVNGGAFSQVGTAPARNNTGSVTFVDTAIAFGDTYQYRVAAVNTGGTSAYSNTAQVVVPAMPAAPGNFIATRGPNGNGNNRSVILTWQDLSNNETGFTIQRATNAAFTSGLNTTNVAANTTTFTQTGLSRNTAYYFRIRANNGTIVFSGWVNASPLPITTNP